MARRRYRARHDWRHAEEAGDGYAGGFGYRPYVPVGDRRALAARSLATLAARRGRPPEPVVPARRGRQIAATFWGRAWCENLERYGDFANRLPRGRSYLRNGLVVDLALTPGQVEALVAGSDLYRIQIGIARMNPPRWEALAARCAGRIGSLVALLRGELSPDVLAILADAREGLFPEPREITLACSCPDWARMCKHVAATLYAVGVRLDAQPELFFTLRQVDQGELVSRAASAAGTRPAPASGKRLAAHAVAGVFGIEIEEAPARAPAGRRAGPGAPDPRRSPPGRPVPASSPSSAATSGATSSAPAAAPASRPRTSTGSRGRARSARAPAARSSASSATTATSPARAASGPSGASPARRGSARPSPSAPRPPSRPGRRASRSSRRSISP